MGIYQSATALTFVYIGVLILGLIVVLLSWLALARSFTAGSQTQSPAASGRVLMQAAGLSLGVAALVFGAVGLLTERALAIGSISSVLWSLAAGLLAGFIVQLILTRHLDHRFAEDETAMIEMVGSEAEVVIPIPADGVGEVVLLDDSGSTHLGARSASGDPIERGTVVIIERVSHRIAIVRPVGEPPPN